jgi:hypothetical protein
LLSEKIKEKTKSESGKINLSAEDLTLIFILKDTFPGLITIFENKKASEINSCSPIVLEEELGSIKSLLEKLA